LETRGLIAVEGPDACQFLQGLVSNDVEKLAPGRALHSAFLTAQGKYLHDFFMVLADSTWANGAILLDCEAGRLDDLLRRLKMYTLRSQVTLADRTGDLAVAALIGSPWADGLDLAAEAGSAGPYLGGLAYVDPRLAAMGGRCVLPRDGAARALEDAGFAAATAADYDAQRLSLGLPDGSRDLVVERAILLENGFDELGSIDWDKGCYMGQELTARTKHRALIKKRLMPVAVDGPLPPAGTPVMLGDKQAGEMRSGQDGWGLALMRLEYLEKAAEAEAPFTAGEARLTPKKPDWASF
jgi:hypothetical protein